MKANIDKLREKIAFYRDELLDALKTLVAIPSVEDAAVSETAPFGGEVARALDTACRMAEDAGATAVCNRHYYAYADFGTVEEGKPYIDV